MSRPGCGPDPNAGSDTSYPYVASRASYGSTCGTSEPNGGVEPEGAGAAASEGNSAVGAGPIGLGGVSSGGVTDSNAVVGSACASAPNELAAGNDGPCSDAPAADSPAGPNPPAGSLNEP